MFRCTALSVLPLAALCLHVCWPYVCNLFHPRQLAAGQEAKVRRLRSTLTTQQSIIVDAYQQLRGALGDVAPAGETPSSLGITATSELGKLCGLVVARLGLGAGAAAPGSSSKVGAPMLLRACVNEALSSYIAPCTLRLLCVCGGG